MKRKYRNISVYERVNVSSSYHHWFSVGITKQTGDEPARRRIFTWSFEFGIERGRSMPKYVVREIERQVREGIESGVFVYYEYDRDENERYENLRYHSDEAMRFIAKEIERWHAENK